MENFIDNLKANKYKLLSVVLALVTVCAIGLAFYSADQNAKAIHDLEVYIEELSANNDGLLNEIDLLTEENEKYIEKYDESVALYDELNVSFEEQKSTIEDLNSQLSSLQSQYDSVKAENEQLKAQQISETVTTPSYSGGGSSGSGTFKFVGGAADTNTGTSTYAGGTVYWVPNGEVYHLNRNCPSLSRSTNIMSGAISESGKPRVCQRCG